MPLSAPLRRIRKLLHQARIGLNRRGPSWLPQTTGRQEHRRIAAGLSAVAFYGIHAMQLPLKQLDQTLISRRSVGQSPMTDLDDPPR